MAKIQLAKEISAETGESVKMALSLAGSKRISSSMAKIISRKHGG
jgi:hypothetical protein